MKRCPRLLQIVGLAAIAVTTAPLSSGARDVPAISSREDAELVATLIRSTLIGLHQANVTGNYTVLRDLGSPQFRSQNTAADLGRIFSPIRDAGIDLESVAVLQPSMSLPPQITDDVLMTIEGRFDTAPVPIAFELVFQLVDRTWRLFSVSVQPTVGGTVR